MKDLGETIRVGLPNAKTRHDVIELCKQTLTDLEASAYSHKLFIRYMRSLYIDTCGGPVTGISLAGIGRKVAIGVAFIDPDDVHLVEGLRGIHAGGAVCHPDDPWSKDLGKTIAVLRAQFVPGDVAGNMAIRMSPWDHSLATSAEELRTQTLRYPWSVMLKDEMAFPALARPAVVDAIRYALRYCLGGDQAFGVTASTATMRLPLVPPLPCVNDLIDAACTLPCRVALTPQERAEKEKAGRAVAAMSGTPAPPPAAEIVDG